MTRKPYSTRELPPPWWVYTLVAGPALLLLLLFAWVGGAFTPERPTPPAFVDQMEANSGVHQGYRRNHAKGLCVVGYFEPSGQAAGLATTSLLQKASRSSVLGRVSLPGGNPQLPDSKAPLLSMALQLSAKDGQEWRTAMLSAPVFVVSTPAAFLAQLQATAPDPATGKPDPARLAAFFASHPETQAFRQWASQATPLASFASTRFNSLNSFRVRNNRGEEQYVRWSLVNDLPAEPLPASATENPDYLFQDLQHRLARQPVIWQLQFQVAQPGDPIADATQAWPAERQTINAGKLVITGAQAETEGACRDINYDPLILPDGFAASPDPLLSARSAVYADAARRRLGEHTRQPLHSHSHLSTTQEHSHE